MSVQFSDGTGAEPPRMHGVMGKPPQAVTDSSVANPKIMLMLLVAMTGVAPISLYMLVPALPNLATIPLEERA